MKYDLIDANKTALPIDRMCDLLRVSVSGYYAWRRRLPSRRQRDDMVLPAHVRARFAASGETHGSPRMHVELRADGLAVGRRRVARWIARERAERLPEAAPAADHRQPARPPRRPRRPVAPSPRRPVAPSPRRPVAPNILDRDFARDGPNRKWGADISDIWTAEGWLYLAIVVDLFSRVRHGLEPVAAHASPSAGRSATG